MNGRFVRRLAFLSLALCALLAGGATRVVQDVCGPFADVPPTLCPYVGEMYYLGITAGTSPTTYSPDNPVTRGQAAVFESKGINQAIARSSRRAALGSGSRQHDRRYFSSSGGSRRG
jgi:S-layer family protein